MPRFPEISFVDAVHLQRIGIVVEVEIVRTRDIGSGVRKREPLYWLQRTAIEYCWRYFEILNWVEWTPFHIVFSCILNALMPGKPQVAVRQTYPEEESPSKAHDDVSSASLEARSSCGCF